MAASLLLTDSAVDALTLMDAGASMLLTDTAYPGAIALADMRTAAMTLENLP